MATGTFGDSPQIDWLPRANSLIIASYHISATTHSRERRINRYFDPTTGQFVSVDPMVNKTLQAYAYAGDDPVDGVDQLGLFGCNRDPLSWLGCVGNAGDTARHNLAADLDIPQNQAKSIFHSYDKIYQNGANGCSFFSSSNLSAVVGALAADEDAALIFDGGGEATELASLDIPEQTAATNIVRGGTLDNIMNQPIDESGLLTNLSVNAGEGVSIGELASYPPVPGYGQISVTTLDKLIEASGTLEPEPLDGNPYHSIISGISPKDLVDIMTQGDNPAKG